jgi:hypothetical protein
VKVVVFRPPPVPAGEAPTIMRRTMRNRDAWDSLPIGMVSKPTVVMDVMT